MSSAIQQLAYLGLEVSDLAAWRSFATTVLGANVTEVDGGLGIQLDARDHRILLTEGPANDLIFVGWQADEAGAAWLLESLSSAGVSVREDPALAKQRGARRLLCFEDPSGIPTEVAVGPFAEVKFFPGKKAPNGFVAGSQGLGHVALTSPDRITGEHFYGDLLGMQLRDRIRATFGPYEVDLAFFGVNRRHHSVAVGGTLDRRLHHLMLQYADLDDLGRVIDRAARANILATTLGKHPNDGMLSGYVKTPSGFEVELGWGGIEVDSAQWEPQTHHRIAIWGHRPGNTRRSP